LSRRPGKNDSIDRSATVTSVAVPNVVTVLMKVSSAPSARMLCRVL